MPFHITDIKETCTDISKAAWLQRWVSEIGLEKGIVCMVARRLGSKGRLDSVRVEPVCQ